MAQQKKTPKAKASTPKKTRPAPAVEAKAEAAAPAGAAPDAETAKAALHKLMPRLRGLAPAELKNTRSDMGAAAIFVVGLAQKIAKLRSRFAVLPADVFDIAHFDVLATAALAAWQAQVQLDSAMATATEAKVPLAVVEESGTVKERMLKVADYHLAHRGEALAREIADIRSGSGHADTASDLGRLRTLYDEQRALLPSHEGDPHYRPDDAAAAGRLSKRIVDELAASRTREQLLAQDTAARAWTFLLKTYEEVAAVGRMLLRKEGGEAMFPSLYTAGRAPAPARGKKDKKKPEGNK